MLERRTGPIKSINVNEKRISQECNLPAEPMSEDIDWDMWLGPAPWAPYNSKRRAAATSR